MLCDPLTPHPVYPRACGGTPHIHLLVADKDGLSPRLRGNPDSQGKVSVILGVYPRACGGTRLVGYVGPQQSGLSPRLRGNRQVPLPAWLAPRSIPAPAGEPMQVWQARVNEAVYPRACGGTLHRGVPPNTFGGLSPRLRGNHYTRLHRGGYGGSIPAPAGEPSRNHRQRLR